MSLIESYTKARVQLDSDLSRVEQMIGSIESSYLQADHSQIGNVVKGFDSYLFSKEALRKRARLSEKKEDAPKPLFSLSSKSSAISREELMDVDGNEHRGQGEPGTFAASARKAYEVKGK